MATIVPEMKATFRAQGFVVVPDVLSVDQVATGRIAIAALLNEEHPAAGPGISLWPRFGAGGHALLDLYRTAGIGQLAGQLLRPDLSVEEPAAAQVAITIPPWPHRPGGPHVDGLSPTDPDGRPGTFTLLAGVWLTDHSRPNRGNLWVWPGTHLRFGRYLAERGADAITRTEEMNPGPYPDIDLGDPIQAMGPAGSVLFAHYLLAHNTGGHDGATNDPRRETVYYRLHAIGHRDRWRETVTSPLTEFH